MAANELGYAAHAAGRPLAFDFGCFSGRNRVFEIGGRLPADGLAALDPYWADLVRLLQIFRFQQSRELKQIENLRSKMSSPIYNSFIENRIRLSKSYEL